MKGPGWPSVFHRPYFGAAANSLETNTIGWWWAEACLPGCEGNQGEFEGSRCVQFRNSCCAEASPNIFLPSGILTVLVRTKINEKRLFPTLVAIRPRPSSPLGSSARTGCPLGRDKVLHGSVHRVDLARCCSLTPLTRWTAVTRLSPEMGEDFPVAPETLIPPPDEADPLSFWSNLPAVS